MLSDNIKYKPGYKLSHLPRLACQHLRFYPRTGFILSSLSALMHLKIQNSLTRVNRNKCKSIDRLERSRKPRLYFDREYHNQNSALFHCLSLSSSFQSSIHHPFPPTCTLHGIPFKHTPLTSRPFPFATSKNFCPRLSSTQEPPPPPLLTPPKPPSVSSHPVPAKKIGTMDLATFIYSRSCPHK